MIRALVFDFDGLILDTEGPAFECWREIYEGHGCALSFETWAACIGTIGGFDPEAHLASLVGRPLDVDALRARLGARFAELVAAERVRPGVEDYLAAARDLGLGLGIASSSRRAYLTEHLARLRLLDRFDVIRAGDEVERVKPAPDLYHAAVEGLGVAPREAVAFEDSPNGLMAAHAAGLRCVAVPNSLTAALDLSAADLLLPSLDALTLPLLLSRFD